MMFRKKKDSGTSKVRMVRRKRGSGISEEDAVRLTRKAEMIRQEKMARLINKVITQNMTVFKALDEH